MIENRQNRTDILDVLVRYHADIRGSRGRTDRALLGINDHQRLIPTRLAFIHPRSGEAWLPCLLV